MADVFSKAKRSFVMSRIRSRGNKGTELALAKLFRRHKIIGWRRQVLILGRDGALRRPRPSAQRGRNERSDACFLARVSRRLALRSATGTARRSLPTFRVRPDFIFRKERLAVFVDGCFWHGCPRHGTQPKGNAAFWKRKFAGNLARDRRVDRALRRAGWRVLRIWEHALRPANLRPQNEVRLVRRILRARGSGE